MSDDVISRREISMNEAMNILHARAQETGEDFSRLSGELWNWFRIEPTADMTMWRIGVTPDHNNAVIIEETAPVAVPMLKCCDTWTEYPTPGNSTECPRCHSVFTVRAS